MKHYFKRKFAVVLIFVLLVGQVPVKSYADFVNNSNLDQVLAIDQDDIVSSDKYNTNPDVVSSIQETNPEQIFDYGQEDDTEQILEQEQEHNHKQTPIQEQEDNSEQVSAQEQELNPEQIPVQEQEPILELYKPNSIVTSGVQVLQGAIGNESPFEFTVVGYDEVSAKLICETSLNEPYELNVSTIDTKVYSLITDDTTFTMNLNEQYQACFKFIQDDVLYSYIGYLMVILETDEDEQNEVIVKTWDFAMNTSYYYDEPFESFSVGSSNNYQELLEYLDEGTAAIYDHELNVVDENIESGTALKPENFADSVITAAGTQWNEKEPNNTSNDANWTYDDDDMYGRITSNTDVDWFKVKFTSAGKANFWLGEIPIGCDFDLFLYASNGTTQLGKSNGGGRSDEQIYAYTVSANTIYYIMVRGFSGTSTSYYKLRTKNYPTTASGDKYEPNNTMTTTGSTSIANNGSINVANIHVGTDVDYYKFTLTARSDVKIDLTNIPGGCDYELDLYNSSGSDLAYSHKGSNDSEKISKTLDAGTYYIEVSPYNNCSSPNYYGLSIASTVVVSGDIYEPNNSMTLSGSSSIANNDIINVANIHVGTDVDYYKFTLTARSDVTIDLTNIPSGCDYELDLYNSSGSNLAYSHKGSNDSEKISKTLDAGTYYIEVSPYNKCSSPNAYRLAIASTAVVNSDKYEPNNSMTTTGSTFIANNDIKTDANIHVGTDVDYYRFTLTARSIVTIDLTNIPGNCDYELDLFNSSGTKLAGSNKGSNAAENISNTLDSGTYYIKVWPYNQCSSTNPYRLAIATTVVISGDRYEPNDTLTAAKTISFNTAITDANIHVSTDIDYYKLIVTAKSTVTIDLTNIPSGSDYELALLNSAGTVLKSSTASSNNPESIIYSLSAGTYYIKVSFYKGASLSFYRLSVYNPTISAAAKSSPISITRNTTWENSQSIVNPIAQSISSGLGFTYNYEMFSWPTQGESLKLKCKWTFSNASNPTSSSVTMTSKSGSIVIATPKIPGKYTLNLSFVLIDRNNAEVELPDNSKTHTAYITINAPINRNGNSITFKIQYVDMATKLISGTTSANDVSNLTKLTNAIYKNPNNWVYGYKSVGGDVETTDALISNGYKTGSARLRGDCGSFTEALRFLSGCLGIDVGWDWLEFDNDKAMTRPGLKAIDNNESCNSFLYTDPSNSSSKAWIFRLHNRGTYKGLYYDPTFYDEVKGPSSNSRSIVYAEKTDRCGSNMLEVLPSDPKWPTFIYLTEKAKSSSATNYWLQSYYSFSPIEKGSPNPASSGNAVSPFILRDPAPPGLIVDVYKESYVDDDNNDLYDFLKLELDVITYGDSKEYEFIADLYAADGTYITSGYFDKELSENTIWLDVENNYSLSLYFNGRAIKNMDKDGPYNMVLNVSDAYSFEFTTSPLQAGQFQADLLSIVSFSDTVIDSNSDGLAEIVRVTATVNALAAGVFKIRGDLFEDYNPGSNFLSVIEKEVSLAEGDNQVTFDFDGKELSRNRFDGSYRFCLSAQDRQTISGSHLLAQRSHTQFAHTNAYFSQEFEEQPISVASGSGIQTMSGQTLAALIVDTGITAAVPGKYNIRALLYHPDGAYIAMDEHDINVTNAGMPIQFIFDGEAINEQGLDGPYIVSAYIYDQSWQLIDSMEYTTDIYNYSQFCSSNSATDSKLTDK